MPMLVDLPPCRHHAVPLHTASAILSAILLLCFALTSGRAGAQSATQPETLVLGGQPFAIIGPQAPWNLRKAEHDGEAGWFAIECREGDRPAGEAGGSAAPTVDRVGFDGWVAPLQTVATLRFSIVGGSGARPEQPGDWLNFFELHAGKAPGDRFENVGPLSFFWQWTTGAPRPEFRILLARQIADPPVDRSSYRAIPLFRSSDIAATGTRHDFVVETRADNGPEGYVRVWLDGRKIVNYRGPFGYGEKRRLYPQFRIYRNTRATPSHLLLKIDQISSTPVLTSRPPAP